MKPETLRWAKAFVLKWGLAFTALMLVVWPALSLPAGTKTGASAAAHVFLFFEKTPSPSLKGSGEGA